MTARLFEIGIPTITLATIGIGGVNWEGTIAEPSHRHDDVANWLWADGSCILWPDGGVIEL